MPGPISLLMWASVFSVSLPARAEALHEGPAWDIARGPLEVDASGRYLVHADGTAFWWQGDTIWFMFGGLTDDEIETYLENRRARGFTVIQAVVDAGNLDRTQWVAELAAAKGMYMGYLPSWGNRGSGYDEASFEAFGTLLAAKLKNNPNIIYILGGDIALPDEAARNLWRAAARGLAKGHNAGEERYDNVPMTFHPIGPSSSLDWLPCAEPWLWTSMVQSGHGYGEGVSEPHQVKPNTAIVSRTYAGCDKPVVDGEPRYETIFVGLGSGPHRFQAIDVRQAAYWALFSGAFGHTYGHNDIWQTGGAEFGGQGDFGAALEAEGALDLLNVRRLMLSRPFVGRQPDQSLITSDPGSGNQEQRATLGPDARYAFVYLPQGGQVTVNLAKLAGPVVAWWYDPRSGEAQMVGEFTQAAPQSFEAPSSGRPNDWVLVLDEKAQQFGAPGVESTQAPQPAAGGMGGTESVTPYPPTQPVPGAGQPGFDAGGAATGGSPTLDPTSPAGVGSKSGGSGCSIAGDARLGAEWLWPLMLLWRRARRFAARRP